MMVLVSVSEAWTNFWNSFDFILTNPTTQSVLAILDNTAVAIAIVVFFKYILPKLRENEANKKLIKEMQEEFTKFVMFANDVLTRTTGVNMEIDTKFAALADAFNTAFQASGIGTVAKRMINGILTDIINGNPIKVDITELEGEAKSTVEEVKQAAENLTEELKTTALDALALQVEAELNKEDTTEQEG